MDTMSEKQYEAAAAFWKRKDAEAVKMPKEELRGWLEDFLKAHSTLALATASSRGVRCTPLEYRWMQERLVILSALRKTGTSPLPSLTPIRALESSPRSRCRGRQRSQRSQRTTRRNIRCGSDIPPRSSHAWITRCTLSGSGRSASMSAARPSKRRGLAPGSPSRCDIKCGRRVQAPGRGLPRRRGSRSA